MSEPLKISIRFFNDREVRAVWDETDAKWWFSVLDVVAVLNEENEYQRVRNYWKYLKAKLKKETAIPASTGKVKKRLTPCLKAISSMKLKLAQPRDFNRSMLISLEGCMILQDKSGRKTFQKADIDLYLLNT